MRVVRWFSFLTLVCFLGLGLGASSCEQKTENALGIQEVKDPATGKVSVVQDPSGGPVGEVVKTAGGIASTVFPGVGTLASIAANGVLLVLTGIFGSIARSRNQQLGSAQTSLNAATVALNATAQGLQTAVQVLPADHAKTLSTILDFAHDAAGVAGHLQDLLQPKMDTAGSGTPALPAPAPKPA